MPDTLRQAEQAELERPPTPADYTEARATPGGNIFPWPRPASKATKSGLFRFAKTDIALTEVAGSWPVLLCGHRENLAVVNPAAANWFPISLPERKPPRCDLLHK